MTQIILFAPMIGALLCGFGWRLFGETAAQVIATGLMFLAAFLSWIVFLTFDGENAAHRPVALDESGSLSTEWGIRLDG